MFLLIDECCSKGLVRVAQALGHTAQRTIEVAALGAGATDAEIHRFASKNLAIIVTENAVDFRRLAGSGKGHPGIILMPSVIGKTAATLFRRVLPIADEVFRGNTNMFVEIDDSGAMTSYQLP